MGQTKPMGTPAGRPVATPAAALTPEQAAERLVRDDPRFHVTEAEIRGIRLPVFANAPATLGAMLAGGGGAHGAGDFVVYKDERWRFEAFCTETCRIAHALSGIGVGPGTKVALAMRNYPEMLILMMAIAAAGGVVVFMNAWWTEEELAYGFSDSGATIAFADGPRHDRIASFAGRAGLRLIAVRDAEAPGREGYRALLQGATRTDWPDPAIDADDDFAVMYSSGSTGHPKGVVMTHRGAISAVFSYLMAAETQKLVAESAGTPLPEVDHAVLVVTPLFHVTATHPVWLQSIISGSRVVLLPKWDPENAVRVIEAERITRFVGVPTQSAELAQAAERMGAPLDTLGYIASGGAKRPPAQVADLTRAFPHAAAATGWGMTETNALGLTLSGPEYHDRPGSAGRLVPPLQQMKIVDDQRREVPVGTVGELAVKSAANMRCYLNAPEATADVLQDGWVYTGDLASVDPDGFVTIIDRKKTIIIRGGENIACLEVEAAIHRHPAVQEAGVFPVPDQRLGETVGAGVMLKPGMALTAADLRAFLAEHIASFKIPEHIWFRSAALPRGATDKIDRRALRKACLALGRAADTVPQTEPA